MDVVDDCDFLLNRDWDPAYLEFIFARDFNDNTDLWDKSMSDLELLDVVNTVERYSPIVEDISLDDEVLCSAVEQIETE